jgi:hypothetical protein
VVSVADVYAKGREGEALDGFVNRVMVALGLGPTERRESSNQAGGFYYLSRALGVAVTLARADEEGIDEDFHFLIHLDVPDASHAFIDALADVVARRLLSLGDSVVRLSYETSKRGEVIAY